MPKNLLDGAQPVQELDTAKTIDELGISPEKRLFSTKRISSYPNLWKYHLEQMKVLKDIADEIADKIKKNMVQLIKKTDNFHGTVRTAAERLDRLNRMLAWGSLSAWFQAEDIQDVLGLVQGDLKSFQSTQMRSSQLRILCIGLYESAGGAAHNKLKADIKKALDDDNRDRLRQIQRLIEMFRKRKATDANLEELLPPAENSSTKKSFFRAFLAKLESPPTPTAPPELKTLIAEMKNYIGGGNTAIPFHVLRTHTGYILTAISAPSASDAFQKYCGKSTRAKKPKQYTPGTHDVGLVVTETYRQKIPTSTKLSPLMGTARAEESEIYIMELEDFHLATIWNGDSWEIVPLRHSPTLNVIDVIKQTCELNQNDLQWNGCRREYKWDRLQLYEHRLIIPGTKIKACTEGQSIIADFNPF
ncbi:hypothetical protein B0H19DRAFT_1370335 [Mycena capillaripes]|nr:hypothetical protein B0H19DRAFT_1370335 [Mycena capillaripes]